LLADDGPYFLRYYHCDMKAIMDIEVGLLTHTVHRGNQALMEWARNHNLVFDALDPRLNESYVCRYEAYLTDHRIEPRKLLWEVELSIKVVDTP